MRAPGANGSPYGEPKDGDFVAYLAQLEQRQLDALRTRAAPHPPLAHPDAPASDGDAPASGHAQAEADALRQLFAAEARQRNRLIGAAVLGLAGVYFTASGLLGDGGLLALLIGLALLWMTWTTARRALRPRPADNRLAAVRRLDDRHADRTP